MILEAIYEPNFSDNSHGFRPNRSCHTCLGQIKRVYTGTKWFVEGYIKGCFDNIDHHVLIKIVRKRINDESFIELLWKFLRAGYLENWEYHTTYTVKRIPMIRPNTEVITPPTASPFPPGSFAIATIPSMAPIIPGSHPIQQQSVRERIPSTREVTANALSGLFCTGY